MGTDSFRRRESVMSERKIRVRLRLDYGSQ